MDIMLQHCQYKTVFSKNMFLLFSNVFYMYCLLKKSFFTCIAYKKKSFFTCFLSIFKKNNHGNMEND